MVLLVVYIRKPARPRSSQYILGGQPDLKGLIHKNQINIIITYLFTSLSTYYFRCYRTFNFQIFIASGFR